MPKPQPITKAEFARRIGVHRSRISHYLSMGMPVRSDGKLDPVEAERWVRQNILPPWPTVGCHGVSSAAQLAQYPQPLASQPQPLATMIRQVVADDDELPALQDEVRRRRLPQLAILRLPLLLCPADFTQEALATRMHRRADVGLWNNEPLGSMAAAEDRAARRRDHHRHLRPAAHRRPRRDRLRAGHGQPWGRAGRSVGLQNRPSRSTCASARPWRALRRCFAGLR